MGCKDVEERLAVEAWKINHNEQEIYRVIKDEFCEAGQGVCLETIKLNHGEIKNFSCFHADTIKRAVRYTRNRCRDEY